MTTEPTKAGFYWDFESDHEESLAKGNGPPYRASAVLDRPRYWSLMQPDMNSLRASPMSF
jgi:hypothetical protein